MGEIKKTRKANDKKEPDRLEDKARKGYRYNERCRKTKTERDRE